MPCTFAKDKTNGSISVIFGTQGLFFKVILKMLKLL